MLISAKLPPIVSYERQVEFWLAADELGYHGVWNYDHLFGLGGPLMDYDQPTMDGWTTLAAMAVHVKRARVGCLVTGLTYRHPMVLANMAVTVDHISGGRLEFGIGASWHDVEHAALGIEFPPPGERVERLDEALRLMKAWWSGERPTVEGRFWSISDAICEPPPVQRPHPPIVVGATQPRMLRLAARHADEWNTPGPPPEMWSGLNAQIDKACAEIGRNPREIRRSVQLFVRPDVDGQPDEQAALIPQYEDLGCEHVVLSFYSPPDRDLLERMAPR